MEGDGDLALFTCTDAVEQRHFNAFGSWALLPGCSVSVLGDAPGVELTARRYGFRSIPAVGRNERGRPRLDSVFAAIDAHSTQRVLGYVNSDILILPGLAECVA